MESSALNAVGVWFYSQSTDRYLYLLRRGSKHPGHWGLAGGKVEAGETLITAMARECREELGFMPDCLSLTPLEKFTSDDSAFFYHTFFACVATEFQPVLNHEHMGYAWIESGVWPKPLHPGLWSTVHFDAVQDKLKVIRDRLRVDQLQLQ